jgi:hypothetical protein
MGIECKLSHIPVPSLSSVDGDGNLVISSIWQFIIGGMAFNYFQLFLNMYIYIYIYIYIYMDLITVWSLSFNFVPI